MNIELPVIAVLIIQLCLVCWKLYKHYKIRVSSSGAQADEEAPNQEQLMKDMVKTLGDLAHAVNESQIAK